MQNFRCYRPQKGLDYYLDAQGLLVFTERYHLLRGYCCQNGCRHCPYSQAPGQKSQVRDQQNTEIKIKTD